MTKASNASGNAVLAKARALYGRRLRAEDYRRLMGCRTMSELAAALKEQPLYSAALADVNPQYARRAQLESLLRQSLYTRYDSLCRYDRSAGSKVYEYFTLCCEVDELTAAEWEYLLAARDLAEFKARFARTKYGPLLGHHEYSVLKEGFFHYRCDWCKKWLRFSTDPTLVMMCYVWLARCEVQDLDHIIEGVHYKLPPEELKGLLMGFDEND